MIKYKAVFNSDKINKYNEIFPVTTLESALEQKWKTGMPMHLSHDYLRPIGWSYPSSLLFEPGVTKLLGMILLPENDEEMEHLNQVRINHLFLENEKNCAPYKDKLLSALKDYKVTSDKFFNDSCVSIIEENIAKKVFSEIFNNLDQDGLYPVNNLKHLGTGVFEVNGLTLFAHPYFRRSYSILNNLNLAFFDYLDILVAKEIEVKIAFDPNMVGLASTYLKPRELEYWWGPKFNNDLTKINPGVSRHKATDLQRNYYSISDTDFFWYSRKGERTLEIEEIPDHPYYIGEEKYICRYVHSIINEGDGEIFHLDGAVRIYSEDMMLERVDLDLSKTKKNTEYIKLFRIDNKLPIADWKRIISDYFKDNRLIGEYFGAADDKTHFIISKEENDEPGNINNRYIPFSLKENEGFFFNYSYQPINTAPKGVIELKSFDSLTTNEEQIAYYELPALELIKLLKLHDIKVEIPSEFKVIAYEDLYYNFPLFLINKNDPDIIATIFKCQHELLRFYSQQANEEIQISFSIEFPFQDYNIRLSFMGSAKNLYDYFIANGFPPNTKKELLIYMEKLADYLKNYKEINGMNVQSMVRDTAMLIYNRTFIGDEIDLNINLSKTDGIHYEVIEYKDEFLLQKLSAGEMEISVANIIYHEECSRCGKNYLNCNCTKVHDKVYGIVKDFEPVGLFYTDKKS